MSRLVIDDVSVRYGDTLALDRFSVEVASGEILAVVGPSGSGKSTLLRAVAGLEPLAAGRVVLGGRDLSGVPTHKRGLGMMFQDHGLFTHLNVADNISYGLRIGGAPRPVRRARVAELLDLVGLTGFDRRRTNELSGGEAQRVALARALAPEPGLLMLDEPLGSLDRALRDQLTADLRRLLTELGQTALHVTHDQAEAFALADRVVVVAAGRPVAVGTPAELWTDPGSRFVAEFLGHPNIWSVLVDDRGAVDWTGHRLGTLPVHHRMLRDGPGRRLVVMPGTGLTVGPEGGDPEGIKVRVDRSVFRNGVHDVSAAVVDGDDRSAGASPVQFTSSQPVPAGETVMLSVDVGAMRPIEDR